jgi:hypothetical protein
MVEEKLESSTINQSIFGLVADDFPRKAERRSRLLDSVNL